jgi:hypothetical protein
MKQTKRRQPNLLVEQSLTQAEKVIASANTGGDTLTSNHIRKWMECIRSRKQPNAPVEAGYSHSIATAMTTAYALVRVPRTIYLKTLPTNLLKTKNFSHLIHNIWLKNIYNHTGV